MSLLGDIQTLLLPLDIPIETGVFTNAAPDTYLVVTPMTDVFENYADDQPQYDVQEARVSLFSKGNYQQQKRQIISAFLAAGYTVTMRSYIGYEADTGYHHYNIDVAHYYETED